MIKSLTTRNEATIQRLYDIWYASVKKTHTFLSDVEIDAIAPYVPQALKTIPILNVIEAEDDNIVGFIGIEDGKIEMLFMDPTHRGSGLGKKLVLDAIQNHEASTLSVNEQNPQAQGFYEHLGFVVYDRSPLDDQGNPYPILHMRLSK